jgi:hypothetical protein
MFQHLCSSTFCVSRHLSETKAAPHRFTATTHSSIIYHPFKWTRKTVLRSLIPLILRVLIIKLKNFTKTLLLSRSRSTATFVATFYHTQPSLVFLGSAANVRWRILLCCCQQDSCAICALTTVQMIYINVKTTRFHWSPSNKLSHCNQQNRFRIFRR